MAYPPLLPIIILVLTVLMMEGVAALVHRYIMHGFGWGWHRSHHRPRAGKFELNDLYSLIFASMSVLLFVAGGVVRALWWVGAGMLVYGLLYAVLHDALVHRRIPFPAGPRTGYLKRLVQAHRLHHAVREREGAVSFGFLYAPPVAHLVDRLRSLRASRSG